MKRRIYQFICAVVLVGSLTACNDFLDVRAKSEKLEGELFENAQGFEDAIYGVYSTLQSSSLYGKDLVWGIPEVLAQNLSCNSTSMEALSKYDYTNDYLRQQLSATWTGGYQAIGYANNILKQLEEHKSLPLYKYYKGEMLAVRALLHFDLLRLFAPTGKAATGIPYSKNYSQDVNEFVTVGKAYELIIDDLKEAEALLDGDKNNVSYPREDGNYNDFLNYRQTHMNLYAVQALLARVYWMKGDLDNAGTYAEKVIETGRFPLVEPTEVQDYIAGTLSPKETIFGIYSTSYVKTCQSYLYELVSYHSYQPFDDVSGMAHLEPWQKVYNQDVDPTSQDYRRNHFQVGAASVKFLKMVDYHELGGFVPADRKNLISGITLLHTSELYLIAAEAYLSSDYNKALGYFNTEIQSRGLPRLADDVTLTADILYNEYHKELFGEGQTWYNMKRLNKDIVSNVETRIIPASDDVYVLPIPEEEFAYRQK